jgi:predicted permease
MEIAINQILVVFLLIVVGVYGKKMKIINSEFNKCLSSLLLNITLPLYIITAFNMDFSYYLLNNLMRVFCFGMLIHPLSFFIAKLFFRKFVLAKRDVSIFCVTFSNCGFMAFPILDGLFGKVGIFYGSIFLAPFNIFIWTLGIRLYNNTYKKINLKIICNPGIIAILIGIVIFVLSLSLPYAIQKTFDVVGSMTTPLSMIITGVLLADLKLKDLFIDISLYLLAFIRLLVIPALTMGLLYLFKADKILLGVCACIAGMPTAAMASVFAEQFNKEKNFSSSAVFLTTLLSLITIPTLIFLLTSI